MSETSALTREDARYEEMFSVEKEMEGLGHAMLDDPYADFARLRAKGPIFAGSITRELTGHDDTSFAKPRPHYTTLSFEAGSKALVENTLYSSLHYHEMPSVMENIGHTILTMVGNEHQRYRGSIQPMMMRPQAMGWWREHWIDAFVDTFVSQIEQAKDGVDLSLQLCARLPMHTVTAAYGLSSDEALEFRDNLLQSMAPMLSPEQRKGANAKVREVLLGAIAERRRERRDDLISRLVDSPFTNAQGEASQLSDEDILSFSRLLLLAGGGTTFRQLGILLFALLNDREQLEALRSDRKLMAAAIQESLRWNCTDPLFHRLAMEDSELEGVAIPEGSVIDVCLGAANRDPEVWDNPDAYDLHRPAKRHLGFAAGPHICLGRFVAEAEMTSAVNALLDRLPKLRFDDRAEPSRIIGGLQARGVNHLKVRFD